MYEDLLTHLIRGPMPQGLNIEHNTVKTVRLEKLNGRRQYRQSATQRRANNRIT